MECKAVEICDYVPDFVSPLHCVAKKGGTYRLILDLRHLNSCIQAPRFRNDDIRVVADLVQNDDVLISVDIKNGFYHVPVHREDRDFLSFRWRNAF